MKERLRESDEIGDARGDMAIDKIKEIRGNSPDPWCYQTNASKALIQIIM